MLSKPGTTKRAARRAALALKKRDARRIYPHDPKARAANHLKICSCHMCGNPRHHWNELTIQERKARASAQSSISEIYP